MIHLCNKYLSHQDTWDNRSSINLARSMETGKASVRSKQTTAIATDKPQNKALGLTCSAVFPSSCYPRRHLVVRTPPWILISSCLASFGKSTILYRRLMILQLVLRSWFLADMQKWKKSKKFPQRPHSCACEGTQIFPTKIEQWWNLQVIYALRFPPGSTFSKSLRWYVLCVRVC